MHLLNQIEFFILFLEPGLAPFHFKETEIPAYKSPKERMGGGGGEFHQHQETHYILPDIEEITMGRKPDATLTSYITILLQE